MKNLLLFVIIHYKIAPNPILTGPEGPLGSRNTKGVVPIDLNTPVSNCASPSVPASNNLKSRLVLSYVRTDTANVLHGSALVSTSGYCSWELKRNSKLEYSEKRRQGFFYHNLRTI